MEAHLIAIAAAVLGVLGTINAYILNGLCKRITQMETKLDNTQTKIACEKARELCQSFIDKAETRHCSEEGEIWDAIKQHSHTGLPSDSKVTR